MFTLTYYGHKAGVVIGESYIYDFDSQDAAREAVKSASQIVVIYQPGNRSRLEDLTPAVIQNVRILAPTSCPI